MLNFSRTRIINLGGKSGKSWWETFKFTNTRKDETSN